MFQKTVLLVFSCILFLLLLDEFLNVSSALKSIVVFFDSLSKFEHTESQRQLLQSPIFWFFLSTSFLLIIAFLIYQIYLIVSDAKGLINNPSSPFDDLLPGNYKKDYRQNLRDSIEEKMLDSIDEQNK